MLLKHVEFKWKYSGVFRPYASVVVNIDHRSVLPVRKVPGHHIHWAQYLQDADVLETEEVIVYQEAEQYTDNSIWTNISLTCYFCLAEASLQYTLSTETQFYTAIKH